MSADKTPDTRKILSMVMLAASATGLVAGGYLMAQDSGAALPVFIASALLGSLTAVVSARGKSSGKE